MTVFRDSRVVVTGAASGLGRRLVLECVRRGASVSAWDINETALAALGEEVAGLRGAGLHTAVVDVGDRRKVSRAAKATEKALGGVDILINNAGIVNGETLLNSTDAAIERSFRVNTLGLFWTTRAFLPQMMERDQGHVVNIASAAGMMGVAGLADYCASKFAAFGFDESLRMELTKQGSRVRTTVVCPYYINTGMFDGVKTRFPWLLPILEEAPTVTRILRAVERDEARLLMPPLVYAIPLMRVLPVSVFDGLATFLGVNASMDDFKGRPGQRAGDAIVKKSKDVVAKGA